MKHSLSVTVGISGAEINGQDNCAIQAGVDYLAKLGGGTLRILPGRYQLNNAIYLRNNICIQGSGDKTILTKNPSVQTTLVTDSDWYEDNITLTNGKGFEVGYGVCLKAKEPNHGGFNVIKRTLVAKRENRFWLDEPLNKNFWADHQAQIATLFPLLTGEHICNLEIRDLVLDGNRFQNQHLDGNYAGCIFLQNCEGIHNENIETRNYNGDGISWQICHDVTVTNCLSVNNADLGLHPGSGSLRPIICQNRLEGNGIGLFFCWGVKHGIDEKNWISNNRQFGVSIGHRDTNNIIRQNRIEESGQVGIIFRDEPNEGRCPHYNLLEDNQIINSGEIGIDIQGETRSITLRRNQIIETRKTASHIGLQIGQKVTELTLEKNNFSGLKIETNDLRA